MHALELVVYSQFVVCVARKCTESIVFNLNSRSENKCKQNQNLYFKPLMKYLQYLGDLNHGFIIVDTTKTFFFLVFI